MAHLDFQVEGMFFHSLSNHAYASHTASRISYHVHVLVVYYVVCFFSGVCFFGLVPVTSRLWGPVRLRPFVFFMDSFFFVAGSQARWSYPRNHFYLCFARCSLFLLCLCYDAYHLLIMPPKLPCQTSNPPCPSKPLIGYVTALLSPSYSVVSCRWRLKFVPCWNMEMLFLVGTCLLVGISQYILFN